MYGRQVKFDVIPAVAIDSGSFSVSDAYLAIGDYSAPYLTIYKRNGETFAKLQGIKDLPGSRVYDCKWGGTASQEYLAVVCPDAPFLYLYKRVGDTFTRLPSPAVMPTGRGYRCSFSHDGNFLAVAYTAEPYIICYKRSGDTFTRVPSIGLPSLTQIGDLCCALSPDGVYLAVAGGVGQVEGPILGKWNGSQYVKLSAIPAGGINLKYNGNCALSSSALVVENRHYSGPGVIIYARSGDTFNRASTINRSDTKNILFSRNEKFLAIDDRMRNADPIGVYKMNGSTVQGKENVLISGINANQCCAISSDGGLLVLGGTKFYDYSGNDSEPYLKGWVADSDALPSAATAVSPKDVFLNLDEENIFTWRHVIETETAQGKAELQYRPLAGTWQELATVTGAATTATIPAFTFPSGNLQWRVRTFNQDGYAGEWSEPAAFQAIGPPPAPTITEVTNASRPTVTWASVGQAGYQLQIAQDGAAVWDGGEASGADTSFRVPIYLPNGQYTARLRIINDSEYWSAWAERAFTIDVGPIAPTLIAAPGNGCAALSWEAGRYTRLYLLRDGTPIAEVTGQSAYRDYAALNLARYVLRAIDEEDNYADSPPAGVTVTVPCPMLAPADAPAGFVPLLLTRGGPRQVSGSVGQAVTYHYYAGRELPVATFSGRRTEAYQVAVSFRAGLDDGDRDRLLSLLARRVTLLYRDNYGNRWYVVAAEIVHTQDRLALSLALTLTRVGYREAIDYAEV